MQRIKLDNFRVFAETGWIDLDKPLNLIVGANSSGKSSLLRLFPLLRQSVEAWTSSPLVLAGARVDLGSFATVLRRGASEPELRLGFELALRPEARVSVISGRAADMPERYPARARITLVLAPRDRGARARLSRMLLDVAGKEVEIVLDERGRVLRCAVAGHDMLEHAGDLHASRIAYIVPSLGPEAGGETTYVPYVRDAPAAGGSWGLLGGQLDGVLDATVKLLDAYLPVDSRRRWEIASSLPIVTESELAAHLGRVGSGLERVAAEPARLEYLHALAIGQSLPGLLVQIDRALAHAGSSVRYVGPARAVAARYDRIRDVAVNELDHRGGNFAMWLESLPREQQKLFKRWMASQLGFRASAKVEGEHVSVRVKDAQGEFNIADMGYGYSQVLPVAAHLWAGLQEPAKISVLAIEQPELHLHPALQAQVGDMLVSSLRHLVEQGDHGMRLVIETHSELIVNSIGNAIADSRLSPELAQVLLFEQPSDHRPVTIRAAHFDDMGILRNWPPGFFRAG